MNRSLFGRRAALVLLGVLATLLVLLRALSPATAPTPARLAGQPPDPAQRANSVAASVVRRTQVFTLANGLTAYRLTPEYTTTIGALGFVARVENRPFDQFGRELPLHFGWHYVHVSSIAAISPTGRWDSINASLSSTVTETVSWERSISQTGQLTMTIGDGLVITRPVFAPGAPASMVLTRSTVSPPVAGWISVTKFISQSGHIVPGTISATLDIIFEVHNSERGLTLNYQGASGVLVIAAEQSPLFYSAAANIADFGFAQFQVKAQTAVTNAVIAWRPQLAPASATGRCEGDLAWADAPVSERAFRDPVHGYYIWQPLYLWVTTSGGAPLGFQLRAGNACARVVFEAQPGVTFTPTIWLRALNP